MQPQIYYRTYRYSPVPNKRPLYACIPIASSICMTIVCGIWEWSDHRSSMGGTLPAYRPGKAVASLVSGCEKAYPHEKWRFVVIFQYFCGLLLCIWLMKKANCGWITWLNTNFKGSFSNTSIAHFWIALAGPCFTFIFVCTLLLYPSLVSHTKYSGAKNYVWLVTLDGFRGAILECWNHQWNCSHCQMSRDL